MRVPSQKFMSIQNISRLSAPNETLIISRIFCFRHNVKNMLILLHIATTTAYLWKCELSLSRSELENQIEYFSIRPSSNKKKTAQSSSYRLADRLKRVIKKSSRRKWRIEDQLWKRVKDRNKRRKRFTRIIFDWMRKTTHYNSKTITIKIYSKSILGMVSRADG